MMGPSEEEEIAAFEAESERHDLSRAGIAEQNRHLIERQRRFRLAADLAAAELRKFDEIEAVSLFGSVALPLWKEVPRFRTYRRAGIELWHECKDVDIAVWLRRLDRLREMRRSINRALPAIHRDGGGGVASHDLDIFLFEPGTDRYFGRMCGFKICPAHKRECLVPGCGATPFLKQHEDFRLYPDALSLAVRLFERGFGEVRRAADLPSQRDDAHGDRKR